MKNKKILFLCPSYPSVGGVEAVTSLLMDFFLDKGFEAFVLVARTEELPGAALYKHLDLMIPMRGVLNTKENLDFIDGLIREKEIGCVFNQGIFSLSYIRASIHKEVLFINTLHSCPFWEVKIFTHSTLKQLLHLEHTNYKKLKVFVRFMLNRIKPEFSHPSIDSCYKQQIDSASYYVVLDQAYKKILENRLYGGIRQNKIKVIPDPLVLPKQALLPRQKTVLYVGRLVEEPKRVDRLLRIWQKIQDKAPDWNLMIVGDGYHREALETMSTRLQLMNVSFEGYQNPGSYYGSAAILCLTSTYEGFGMVLTEAQSYGTIPVSFRCSESVCSIIDHGVNGLIIEPFDEDSYAGALLALIKDDSLRDRMSQKAKEKASEYDIEKIGQIWLDLMDRKLQ